MRKKNAADRALETAIAAQNGATAHEIKRADVGGVLVDFYPDSLCETVAKFRDGVSVHEAGRMAAHAGVDAIEDRDSSQLKEVAATLVQISWYEQFKGAIPMAVKEKSEKRVKAAKVSKKKENGNGTGGERKATMLRVGAKYDPAKLKGQAADVASTLAKLGEATGAQVVAACSGKGAFAGKSAETTYNNVRFHLSKLRGAGVVVGA